MTLKKNTVHVPTSINISGGVKVLISEVALSFYRIGMEV